MELLIQYADLLIFLLLIFLGASVGSWLERRHYSSILAREKISLRRPLVNIKSAIPADEKIHSTALVRGSAVISLDYFKRFLAILRLFFGGRVRSYESLLDRARREALLRMAAEADDADMVLNVRLETANIGKGGAEKGRLGSVEALAYGTAVWLRK